MLTEFEQHFIDAIFDPRRTQNSSGCFSYDMFIETQPYFNFEIPLKIFLQIKIFKIFNITDCQIRLYIPFLLMQIVQKKHASQFNPRITYSVEALLLLKKKIVSDKQMENIFQKKLFFYSKIKFPVISVENQRNVYVYI